MRGQIILEYWMRGRGEQKIDCEEGKRRTEDRWIEEYK
jgi:hypothetical protein